MSLVDYSIFWSGYAIGRPYITIDLDEAIKVKDIDPTCDYINKFQSDKKITRSIGFIGSEPLVKQDYILSMLNILGTEWHPLIRTTGLLFPDYNLHDKVFQWDIYPPKYSEDVDFRYDKNLDSVRWFSKQSNITFNFKISKLEFSQLEKFKHDFNIPWRKILLSPMYHNKRNLKPISDYCLKVGCNLGNPILSKYKVEKPCQP